MIIIETWPAGPVVGWRGSQNEPRVWCRQSWFVKLQYRESRVTIDGHRSAVSGWQRAWVVPVETVECSLHWRHALHAPGRLTRWQDTLHDVILTAMGNPGSSGGTHGALWGSGWSAQVKTTSNGTLSGRTPLWTGLATS